MDKNTIDLLSALTPIIGAIIGGIFAIWVEKIRQKAGEKNEESSDGSKRKISPWLWGIGGIIIGAIVGVIAVMIFLGDKPLSQSDGTISYDNFDGEDIDRTLWLPRLDEQCRVSQQDNVLVFQNETPGPEGIGCFFIVNQERPIAFADLGSFQSKIKIASNREGNGYINQGLEFSTENSPKGFWAVFCGLNASSSGDAHLEFSVRSADSNREIFQEFPASFDQWYDAKLELDPNTMEIRCLIDGRSIGSIVSKDTSELKDSLFDRYLNMWRSQNTIATSYADDVKINSQP